MDSVISHYFKRERQNRGGGEGQREGEGGKSVSEGLMKEVLEKRTRKLKGAGQEGK